MLQEIPAAAPVAVLDACARDAEQDNRRRSVATVGIGCEEKRTLRTQRSDARDWQQRGWRSVPSASGRATIEYDTGGGGAGATDRTRARRRCVSGANSGSMIASRHALPTVSFSPTIECSVYRPSTPPRGNKGATRGALFSSCEHGGTRRSACGRCRIRSPILLLRARSPFATVGSRPAASSVRASRGQIGVAQSRALSVACAYD